MSNQGKSPSRIRVEALLDANSFVEIGAGVTARSTDFNMSGKKEPSDGVITGYGQIDGNPVYVYSQDAAVLHGTIGEMHAKKIVALYKMALKTGAPVIGLIDCAGMRLEEATDSLHAFGKIYMAQANASGVIPQISAVFGMCGGGMALVPGLSDFTFMEQSKANLFVNAPNALAGNSEDVCNTASAEYQSTQTGLADVVGTEDEILAKLRTLVSILPSNLEDDMSGSVCTDDLNRVIPDLAACAEDPALLLPRISDNSFWFETGSEYGTDMVTAFIRLNGCTAGVVANRRARYAADGSKEETGGKIGPRGASKAADFVNFCDAFSIPVISFVNTDGFKATVCTERGMARAASRLVYAFANATTPKISVIIGNAFSSAYLVMNSKPAGADLVYAWPEAKIGMMDAKAAAKILCDGQDAAAVSETAKAYDELQNSVTAAAGRGYVDAVIDPAETRKYLIGALDMLFTKREMRPGKKHGTV